MVTQVVRFRDRSEAGQLLAQALLDYAHRPKVLVLGLPRGGVPVAFEVAQTLAVPLDICLVRKLGVPYHPELAMGAIAPGGVMVLNRGVVKELDLSRAVIDQVAARERRELERRERAYRGDRPLPEVRQRTVILVDDGVATGSTLHAAIATLHKQQPAQIIVAVPVGPPTVFAEFGTEADRVVCLLTPEPLHAIGLWYEDFSQTSDEEVRALLARSELPVQHGNL
ncbi:phosphoribosyltransferase [Anthocerotibacter panamensis]|uniref:phosphoribosyltransferase n=1 Tax=Anthocerotibacter panamensis TaxID=2857077 RepID=UPI001C406471|nr:phosphoribosyltransferase [Anthocerotibacter panamensis]